MLSRWISGKPVFILPFSGLVFFQTGRIVPPPVFQLPQRFRELPLGLLQLLPRLRQGGFSVFVFLQALLIIPLAVLQRLAGVLQLFQPLGLFVRKLGPGVLQSALGVAADAVGADVALGLGEGFDRFLHGGHRAVVFLGIGLGFGGARCGDVEIGVIIQVEAGVADVNDASDGAVAHRGTAPLHHGNIIARGHHAHHRVIGDAEDRFPLLRRQQRQGAAHVQQIGQQVKLLLHHAFVRALRPAAAHQERTVERILVCPVRHTVEPPHQRVAALQKELTVGKAGGHDGAYARHACHGPDVVLLQTQAAHDPQIVKIGVPVIIARGAAHVGGGGQKSGQKARAQRHNGKNGEEPAEGPPHRPGALLEKRPLYHSICSTGTGEGLRSLLTIFPLLTRMTRSAMAVSAVLWVMTITVLPVERQVSCSSLRMLFPVT